MTGPRRPTRATSAGRAYLDLQNLARRRRRPTDELHQLYALEGFLARLASSTHANQLILKGGALLAAYDTSDRHRDTRQLGPDSSAVALVRVSPWCSQPRHRDPLQPRAFAHNLPYVR